MEQRNERQTTEQNNPRIPIGTQFQYNGQDVITIPYDHYQQLINVHIQYCHYYLGYGSSFRRNIECYFIRQ